MNDDNMNCTSIVSLSKTCATYPQSLFTHVEIVEEKEIVHLELVVQMEVYVCEALCSVCVENVTGRQYEVLETEVRGMWLVRKIYGLLTDTIYSLSVCAVTSVGRGPSTSVSAATQPPSRQSAYFLPHFQLCKVSK